MEALVERLEKAVIRLEVASAKLHGCSEKLTNGDINGHDGNITSCSDVWSCIEFTQSCNLKSRI